MSASCSKMMYSSFSHVHLHTQNFRKLHARAVRNVSLSEGDTVDRSGGHYDKWNELEGQTQQELHAYAEFLKVKFKERVVEQGQPWPEVGR